MEERRENEYTEYTGEYGNAIQGDYEEDSTYRYSYQNGDESTHSGDYYAAAGEHNGQKDASGEHQAESAPEERQGETGIWQDAADREDSSQGQNSAPSQGENAFSGQNGVPPQGGSGFLGQPPIPPGGAGYYESMSKPPKKPVSFGMKLLATAVCAVVFGLVAGMVFNGYDYLAGRLKNAVTDSGKIEKTTVNSNQKEGQPESKTSTSGQNDKKDVAAITEQAMPAVVAITSTTQGGDYYDLFGQYYQGRESTSSGSGFIVGQNDKELLIATNNHVVDNAKTISVQFIDGEIYEAKEKGGDSSNDLAVIAVTISTVKKTTMEKIKIADLGNSDKAKVGEMVIAIGNALGYGQSVTVGYISAKDREITEADESGSSTGNKIKALQTDAAINPGNSGGALINMQGQVIGINSAKIAASAVEGVGYAIPISVATPIIDELKNKEILSEEEKGYLGITGTEVTEQASIYNMPYGVYVKELAKGGAAEKGGIKVGDVITAVNKAEVTTMESLQEKVTSYRKGTKITVTVQRSNNGKYQKKNVTVQLQGKESLDSLSDEETNQGNNGSNNGNNGGSGDNGSDNGNNGGQGDGGNGSNGSDGSDDFGSLWDFFR